jgi:NAD(P)-dependent dehydrogenase (short-subunit alcohol dehydrogenase family)
MDMLMNGNVAFVTGGGNGIGRATALALCSEGVSVAVADVNREWANLVTDELTRAGGSALALTVDVTDEESVSQAIQQTASHFGGIDHLVLCAGVSGLYGRTLDDITTSEWDQLFAVNVRGQWLPVKWALPHLRQKINASIVVVASDSAVVASPLHVPYCASKGALIMLIRAMAVDLRADNIRVNCVCPSVVNTRQPKNDMGLADDAVFDHSFPVHEPEDIANYLLWLSSPRTKTINGHALVADFGYSGQSSFPF